MNIALDYDKTYTEDPVMWDTFICMCLGRGHKIYIVTARDPRSPEGNDDLAADLTGKTDGIFYTSGMAKREFMEGCGKFIDIWIDDMPERIIKGIV